MKTKLVDQRDAMVQRLDRVAQWRAVARDLGLEESRISWLGPVEKVALRVLSEAKFQGCLDHAAESVEKVARSWREPPALHAALFAPPMQRLTDAAQSAILLGEAAQALLLAQSAIFVDGGEILFASEVKRARRVVAEAVAHFDRTRRP